MSDDKIANYICLNQFCSVRFHFRYRIAAISQPKRQKCSYCGKQIYFFNDHPAEPSKIPSEPYNAKMVANLVKAKLERNNTPKKKKKPAYRPKNRVYERGLVPKTLRYIDI